VIITVQYGDSDLDDVDDYDGNNDSNNDDDHYYHHR
jgi:hypothetical protein